MKRFAVLALCLGILALASCGGAPAAQVQTPDPLPAPSVQADSEFGVDANINMETIDGFLRREDVCYRDVRMLFDLSLIHISEPTRH